MGFQIRPISRKTSLKRSLSSRHDVTPDTTTKTNITPQPPAPFNSTSFLIRQQSQHREEQAARPPVFDIFEDLHVYQYGSNSNSLVACCSFDTNRHDLGCGYKSQADRPVIIGFSTEAHDRPPYHHHRASTGATSPGTRKREHEASSTKGGLRYVKHRQTRSVQDDNFALLRANPSCAKTQDEFVDENLISHFCGLEI